MSGTTGMSLSDDVPTAIRAVVDAANAGDVDRFVAAFTPDALLSEPGREYRGRDEIGRWARSAGAGGGSHVELLGVRSADGEQQLVATVAVSGGYTGTVDLHVALRGDEVARLAITP